MLPRFFGWPQLFDPAVADPAPTPFPRLAAWYSAMRAEPAAEAVRAEIWAYWEEMEAAGQFKPIVDEIAASADPTLKLTYGVRPTALCAPTRCDP